MAETVQIQRNPFARQSLMRRLLPKSDATCDWCGGVRKCGGLFKYEVHTDGGHTYPIKGEFCNVACMRAYTY